MPLDGNVALYEVVVKDEVLDLLRRGKARIEKGWCQAAVAIQSPEAYCARGAITIDDICFPQSQMCGGCYSTAYDYLRQEAAGGFCDLPGGLEIWNDTPGRTQEEVIDLYDRSIEKRLKDID